MIKRIANLEALKARAAELKRRRFRPGFDNMTASAAILWLQISGDRLCHDLVSGCYKPMPAVDFRVAKKNGKYRQLCRLTAIDSIIQMQILDVLTPLCEDRFSASSFAYRPARGVNSALELYCRYGTQHRYAERMDVAACYDNINHDLLACALEGFGIDQMTIRLVMRFAAEPIYTDGEITERSQGLLQGAPISPLLCNVYLHSLDTLLDEQGVPFIRYADDIVVFADDPAALERAAKLVKDHLASLKLAVQSAKRCTGSPAAMEFLNARFEYDEKGILALREEIGPSDSYRTWQRNHPTNPRRTVDVLSDGILRQKDYALAFESDESESNIPIATMNCINIYSDVVFDSGFFNRAAANGICVNLFDRKDRLIGHFVPVGPLKAPKLTHEQLAAYYDPERRLALAKAMLLACVHNIRLNIRYHRKQYDESGVFSQAINRLDIVQKEIKACGKQEELLILEAQARNAYYDCFEDFLRADGFVFEKRSRRPPHNEINAVVSFGNVVLYNWFAVRINRSALDVRVAFLHATNKRKESLNLDLADIFKPLVVDRVALALINRRALQKKHFIWEENGGVYLSQEGKRIYLQAFYEKLEEMLTIKDKSMHYHEIMAEEINKLIRHFREKEKYVPYKQVR